MVLPEPVGAGLLSEQFSFSPVLFTLETPPVFLLTSASVKVLLLTVTALFSTIESVKTQRIWLL